MRIRQRIHHWNLITHVVPHHLRLTRSCVRQHESVVFPAIELIVTIVPPMRRIFGREVFELESVHERTIWRRVFLGTDKTRDVPPFHEPQ